MIQGWRRKALLGILCIGGGSAMAASVGQFVPEEVPSSPLEAVRVLPPRGGTVHGPGSPAEGLKGAGPAKADGRIAPDQVKHRSDAKDGHLAKGGGTGPRIAGDRTAHPGGGFEPGPPVKPKPRSKPGTPEK